MTSFLLRTFVRGYENTQDPLVRSRYAALEAGLSVGLNLVLAFAMLLGGLYLNSIALTANAAHTAADVMTSVTVFLGFRAASKPADERHPHGHGRAEDIATLVIAVLLLFASYEFLTRSFARYTNPEPVGGSLSVVAALLFAAGIKEWLARFAIHLGKSISSGALAADAWHHRTDAISMSLVSVAVWGAMSGYPNLDAVLGAFVALLIGYTGFQLAHSAVSRLLGESAPAELLEQIDILTRETDGVLDTHKVVVHQYGQVSHISLHIQVDPDLPVRESHEIAARVKYRVSAATNATVTVHVEPHA